MCNCVQQIALVVHQLILNEEITNALLLNQTVEKLSSIIKTHERELNKLIIALQKSTLTKRERNALGKYYFNIFPMKFFVLQ